MGLPLLLDCERVVRPVVDQAMARNVWRSVMACIYDLNVMSFDWTGSVQPLTLRQNRTHRHFSAVQ
jgi:hypothetical protein